MVATVVALNEQNPAILEAERVFHAQKAAYAAHPYPSADERIELLNRFRDAILRHADDIVEALNRDFGNRSAMETQLAEIATTLEGIKHATRHLRRWMRPERRQVGIQVLPASARVIRQPLGVIGIIVPWNYPFFLACGPLINALAAGNRAMIKMSGFSGNTAAILKTICAESFDEAQVAVIAGEGGLGQAFARLPWDHLVFTGSTQTGASIMHAAADNLTPVTLELGGKSPAIISDTVPMGHAAERIAWGKCFNAGQTCVAPDYVLCPRQRVEEFISEFSRCVATMYPTMLHNPDFTSVINERQRKRLIGLLDEARDKGARVIAVNPGNEDFSAGTNKLPVHIVTNVSDDMAIAHEEIFGPILLLVPYDGLDSALRHINSRPRPLALYYFDYDQARCDYVLHHTHSGGVCLNDVINHVGVDDIPFGGVGASGMGHYHGHEGFLQFSKAKGVFDKGRVNSTKLAYPPYGSGIQRFLLKLLVK